MTILAHCRPNRLFAFLLPMAFGLCGCGSPEEIRTYTVEKQKAPPAPVVDANAASDRMLGAIVPAGGRTWYFKVTGPAAAIDNNANKINEFFQTIAVKAGADQPEWKAPEGWEQLGPSGMRAATLKIPADEKPLELTVIALPSSGAPNELLDNVNRWRGQLQLPAVDEVALAQSVKESQAGDAKMWLVDLRGKASASGMMAPFAGGGPFSGGARPPGGAPFAGGAAPQSSSSDPGTPPSGDLPPGHPPVAADGGPVDHTQAAPFTFAAPDSWQPQAVSGMRKAAFIVKDGDKQAEITAIDLVASAPSIADPLQNVNMWRGDLGLEPFKEDQVTGVTQKIEVDGKPSNYFELIPDAANPAESKVNQATFAASVPAGKMIWFFKMKGDRDLVVAQRDNFKSFLESIRFSSDGGAGDGN
jgi:hypothetical protein